MEAQVKCPSCGRSVPLKKFCNYCGASLEGMKPEVPETPASEQVAVSEAGAVKSEAAAGNMVVKVAPVETIVNSLKIDFPKARTISEEKKLSFFTSLGFFKPKPEEVVMDSFAAGYEVFLKAKGNYHIDYYRNASYRVSVDDQVREVIIFGQTLTPVKTEAEAKGFLGLGGERKAGKEVRLDGEERIVKDFSADILYNDSGVEVSQPSILKAEANPEGEQILKKGINVESLRLPPEAIVEKFKPKILQRPSEAARVVEEVLDISQVSMIYSPFYHTMYVNKRSKEMKQLRIDGVSGEIILAQKASKWETLCPSCGRKITLEEKFCGECAAKLLP